MSSYHLYPPSVNLRARRHPRSFFVQMPLTAPDLCVSWVVLVLIKVSLICCDHLPGWPGLRRTTLLTSVPVSVFFFFFGKPTTLLAVLENEGLKAKPRLESSVPFLLLFPHSQVREYSIAGLAVKFVLIPLLPNIP